MQCICTDVNLHAWMHNQSMKTKQMDMFCPLWKHTVVNEVEIIQYCVCAHVCELVREQ